MATAPRAADSRRAEPGFTRPALAPGLLAAIVLFIGAALIGTDWFTAVRYAVAILAAIVAWFALKGRSYWWLIVLVPIIVLWNPVLPLPLSGPGWFSAQLIAPILFVAAGVMITVPVTPHDARRGSGERQPRS
ncbi:hypothetical protein GCM10027416_24500 [Okibacterium endophyticum]